MCKKALGMFLAGTLFLFSSCVDDTYDLANKEIAMDMQMKGNKLALPLGSLRPFMLDSLLDLESIGMIKADSGTRCYSFSMDSNLVTKVEQKDLGVLEEVSSLSADIDPIAISLGDIKIDRMKETRTEELDFADVKIDDVSLDETKEEVTLAIGEIELKPIPVSEQSHESEFEIPTVNVDNVPVDRIEQSVSFAIDDIPVTSASSPAVENTLTVEMPSIPMDNYTRPALTTATQSTLEIEALNVILGSQADDVEINPIFYGQSFDFNVTQEMENTKVGIKFSYTLPEQIETLNRVVLANSDNSKQGALIDFVLTNPTLLDGINNRSVSFGIQFPSNYVLAVYDNNYTLSGDNVLSVNNMSASGDETHIRFYLKGINGLDADKFYTSNAGSRVLSINEEVEFNVTYKAEGSLSIPTSIKTIGQLKQGITYSMALDSEFDIDEVYGDINAVESTLDTKELDFSFSIDELDYIKQIDKVVLDPATSILSFSTTISKELGNDNYNFDLDYPNSKIILSLPTEYVFDYDNIKLPEGVKRVAGTNDFEVSTIKAFYGGSWTLPVKEININGQVIDGKLSSNAKAHIKAVSGNTEGKLTVKAMDNLALIDATELLCETRSIKFEAAPATLTVDDVTGATNAIDIALNEETFSMDFEINDLEYVQSVDFVQFEEGQKITLSSSSPNSFGDIMLEQGSYIALRFPEEFVFDYNNCSLKYDATQKAFKIDNLDALKNASWDFAIEKININADVDANETLKKELTISISPVNAKGEENTLYIAGIDNFSLLKMREDGLFNDFNITFALEETKISVHEVEGKTKNIAVEFAGETVSYDIDIKDLKYISHIGNIDLKAGSNFLKFSSSLAKDLGNFNLAQGSYIELAFPEAFVLDPANCTVPQDIEVSAHAIKVKSLKALSTANEWKLAVKNININEDISGSIKKSYSINVVAYDAEGKKDQLTIAAIDPFRLTDVKKAGGTNKMVFTILPTEIEIADIEASVGEMDFEFASQTFEFPVSIPDLDKVNEVKHISFKKDGNKINLKIKLTGTSIAPFKLADKSVVKISFPKEFVFDTDACDFGKLEYVAEDKALYIRNISDIENAELVIALDRLQMDKKITADGKLEWDGEIKVAALNTETGTEGMIYVAGLNDVKYSQIENALSDKTVTFEIPEVKFGIEEAVIVSNTIETEIKQNVDLNINQQFAAAIDRIDRIGFTDRVPMTLSLKANGLSDLDAPVNVKVNIALPSVFDISKEEGDGRITISDKGLDIDIAHNFSKNNTIELKLWVNSLDFTTLEGGFLALQPVEGKADERVLNYESQVTVNGSAAIGNAELSSDLLNEDISMDIAFELGEIKLKDFTGIYGGKIDPVSQRFELGIEDGFSELEKNGLKLANTKPEFMITINNSIGVPVDVALSIVGKDAQDKVIPSAVITPDETLRIKPAKFNDQNELVPETTRWLFTSNEDADVPGYEKVVIKNLDSLLNVLPYAIDFELTPTIVTKENGKDVLHYVDLSKPLELSGSYSISVPFDLQFAQSIPLNLGEDIDAILRDENNNITLANPQLALTIYNPIAQELSFDLSLVGKNAKGEPISTATIDFENDFVLAAGQRNDDGSITPQPTRWLFAVNDSIKRDGFETKAAPALGTLLNEIPNNIDIALNAHFNTDLTKQIDYNNDLELLCEYGVMVPLQFDDLRFTYADTIADLKLNLDETLDELGLSLSNVELGLSMNLKNTLPVGLTLDLIPLDAKGNKINGIEIGTIELPAGDGSSIADAASKPGTPVEFSIRCASTSVLSTLDKVSFSIDVASGNGDNALSGLQGLQVCDIVLQVMCDVEIDLGK